MLYKDFFDDKCDRIDELTKVYSRDVIFSYMTYLISKNQSFNIGILDIDNFKYVNDGHGHKVGDRALYEVSRRIEEILGDRGVVGRYGGDEFMIIIPGSIEYDDTWNYWHDILECTRGLRSKDVNDLNMTVTIGSSRFPKDSTNLDGLFELADKALYRGKMKGRNCFIIYLPEKHANINLKTERDKVISSDYIYATLFSKITHDNLKDGITESLNSIGSFFMIDHLCLSDSKKLYFEYFHPICKQRNFKVIDNNIMKAHVNPHTGIFYKNFIGDGLNNKLTEALESQGIYSAFWVQIKAHGVLFGYVRADIVLNPSGRIWQNLDVDVLLNFAHLLAEELYYRNLKIEDIK